MEMVWNNLSLFKALQNHIVDEIPVAPTNYKIGFVVIREFMSTSVLTTEGQTLDVEAVRAGRNQANLLSRVVLQKRKQVAPERRSGRALIREYNLGDSKKECQYMKEMCGKCPDCLLYGFAATSNEGSQRSRIMTDSCFSIRSYEGIQRSITLNAIEDTTKGGVSGSAFAEREHVRPQVFFPAIETVVDVTWAEALYVLRNILTTTRYGAESNRQGYVQNHLVAIIAGRGEVLSNLALTQRVYDDMFMQYGEQIHEFPLQREQVCESVVRAVEEAATQVFFPVQVIKGDELAAMLGEVRTLMQSEEGMKEWLAELKQVQEAYLKKK
jgi:CRISPR-associated protein Csc2